MDMIPLIDNQMELKIKEICLVFETDSLSNEQIKINVITDWSFDYQKRIESTIEFEFYGILPRLEEFRSNKKHLKYIKVIGELINYDPETGDREKNSFVWNITCDMYIDGLEIRSLMDEPTTSRITFTGDIL